MSNQQRRWLITAVTLITIVFGILALGKPYWTLETTPIWLALLAFILVFWPGSMLHRGVVGALVLVVAITLVVSRDFSIALLVYGSLAYLVFSGIHALGALRHRRWFTGLLGAGLVLLGILGWYWLDVSSIVIGLLIGPVLIVVSAVLLYRVWREHAEAHSPKQHGRFAIALGRIGSVLVLLIALAATFATGRVMLGAPEIDGFANYDWPTNPEPGRLVRAESFDRGMPDNSVATRILYTTTGLDGELTFATALVIVPADAPDEPLPVILWAHGTTGIAVTCAPTALSDPLVAGALLFGDLPLAQGWAIVAPDYIGLGTSEPHPYLVGVPTAQSSLDAVRAARQLESVSLSDQTVVWGHSQGGGTALWIGIEAEEYAPDVPLLGVAAMSPASDLPAFIDTLMSGPAGPIFGGYIMRGYSDAYADVNLEDYIRPGARYSQEKLAERCLSDPSFIVSVLSALIREPFTDADVHEGPLYTRLQENVPASPTGIPIFLGQGEADTLILPEVQTDFVSNLCAQGQIVEFHTYEGRDHMGVVAAGSPMLDDLMTWTNARFAGDIPPGSCTMSER